MNPSEGLVDDLTLLSDALDDPVIDLYAVLSVLTDDLLAAIPHYLGLAVTLQVSGNPIILSTLDPDHPHKVRSSLYLLLLPLTPGNATGNIAFYSGALEAFVDLANDAKWIFNLDGYPILDQHLWPIIHAGKTGIEGFADLRDINQAIGCIIEDGRTLAQAQEELRRLAERSGCTQGQMARRIIASINSATEADTEF